MNFGRSLVSLRFQQGISQAELAGRAGVAQSTVSDIESGRIDPKFSTALKLLHALGVSRVEIAHEDGEVTVRLSTGPAGAAPDVAGAIADSLAVLRGRAQLAEERLRRHVAVAVDDLSRQLGLIQAEVDRLGRMVGLLRYRNT